MFASWCSGYKSEKGRINGTPYEEFGKQRIVNERQNRKKKKKERKKETEWILKISRHDRRIEMKFRAMLCVCVCVCVCYGLPWWLSDKGSTC